MRPERIYKRIVHEETAGGTTVPGVRILLIMPSMISMSPLYAGVLRAGKATVKINQTKLIDWIVRRTIVTGSILYLGQHTFLH
jgi:hypothetical protein